MRELLVYHPYIHFVVPGGGVKVDEAGRALVWQATADDILMHHGTLIRVDKATLTDAFDHPNSKVSLDEVK